MALHARRLLPVDQYISEWWEGDWKFGSCSTVPGDER